MLPVSARFRLGFGFGYASSFGYALGFDFQLVWFGDAGRARVPVRNLTPLGLDSL